ncbi:MAG: Crp/Fnr family transcriptional regulator [Bacteroidales bacterium]|nr:Crp/Fnr family transcriptional regulator [Bacteroidales bacterium]
MNTISESDQEFICDISAPCFQMLSPEEIEFVRASKTQVSFRKGDTLTKQGAFASYILFIVNGIGKQYIEGEQNKSFNMSIVKPGDFVGLSSVYSKSTYNYSVVAITDCQAFLIENAAVEHVAKMNSAFSFNIIKRYCQQNTKLFDTLRTVLYKQMNGRLADTLLYLEAMKPEMPEIFQMLSRKDIADFAGISTESAVKLLKSFEKEEIISLNEKDIILIDTQKLQLLSKNG